MTGKDPYTAATLGFFLGPFGYLYFGKFGKCIGGLVVSVILIIVASFIVAPLLWIFFAYDCYNTAKDINRNEKLKNLQLQELGKKERRRRKR